MNPIEIGRGFLVDLERLPFLFKLGLLWIVGASCWQWWKQRQKTEMVSASVAWPAYQARVVWAQVSDRKKEGRHGDYYSEGLLTYSYTVPGQEIEVGEYRKRFEDEEEADAWARGLRDTFIEVRVDPADAKRSLWQQAEVVSGLPVERPLFERPRSQPPEFWGVPNLAAMVVLCVSCVGALIALWAHVSALMGKPILSAEHNTGAFFAMHVGAIMCGLASSMLKAKQSVSGAKRTWGGGSMKQGYVDATLLKVLGGYVTVVFLYGWVRTSANGGAHGKWGDIMFSSVWLLFYLTSALACWRRIKDSQIISAEV